MSTVDLQAKPDLAYIATHARNADFNPKVRVASSFVVRTMNITLGVRIPIFFFFLQRFPAVFVKLREPKATALVFNSGKVRVCKQYLFMST